MKLGRVATGCGLAVLLTACAGAVGESSSLQDDPSGGAADDAAVTSMAAAEPEDEGQDLPAPDATAAWDSALARFSEISTLEYTIDSALLEDYGGFSSVRTTVVDRERGVAEVHATVSGPSEAGQGVPQDLEMIAVLTPDSALLHMPGWVSTMPEMEGRWLELTPDLMGQAGLPGEVARTEMRDFFPPLELVDFAPLTARAETGTTVISGTVPAVDALSLLGLGTYLSQNPDAALALTGSMAAETTLDESGFLLSLSLLPEEHTIEAGDDPALGELMGALPYGAATLTVLAVDEKVEITVPPAEDRVSDLPTP